MRVRVLRFAIADSTIAPFAEARTPKNKGCSAPFAEARTPKNKGCSEKI